MIRVLFVTATLNVGGAERSLIKAANLLRRNGREVAVFVLDPAIQALTGELDKEVQVHYGVTSRALAIRSILLVRRFITRWRPDTVVGWSTFVNLLVALIKLPWDRWRLVLSERLYMPEHFRALGQRSLRGVALRLLIPLLYRRANMLTANSARNVRFLKRITRGRVAARLLPNTVDCELLRQTAAAGESMESQRCEGNTQMLFLGRLVHQKGLDILLEALPLVDKRLAYQLWVVGHGPELAKLAALARRLGVADRVVWHGAHDNPFPYVCAADFVVMPSRYEGFPNVMLESMALGRAVVATNCRTGPRELSGNGRFAVLVPVDDPRALAAAISELGRDRERRLELGRKAQEHVRAVYDMSATASTYLAIFA